MKVVIPVAGVGSRLKPHTSTVPKPLMEVAGKSIIDYIIEDLLPLKPTEFIFIVGYRKVAMKNHIRENYPQINAKFVHQKERNGDGAAIRIGLEKSRKDDEVLVLFGDVLIDFKLQKSLLKAKKNDALVYGMEVDQPQHYGIMNLDKESNIYQVEEKPQVPKSNLAIIGAYYFKSSKLLYSILEDLYKKQKTIKGEYKLVQALEEYIRRKDLKISGYKTKKWFDCGRPEVLLAANKYFLQKNSSDKIRHKGSNVIIPPCFIAKDAIVERSVIGPYASIGKGAKIKNSHIHNTIVGNKAYIENANLDSSLVGKEVKLYYKANSINIGEKSEIQLQ